MGSRKWSIQNAKNRFSEVVEAARRVPQTVTKHGKPAVAIVDATEYQRPRNRGGARVNSPARQLVVAAAASHLYRNWFIHAQQRE